VLLALGVSSASVAQIDTICSNNPYGLYSVDLDENNGEGSVNSHYDWSIFIEGSLIPSGAVVTDNQGVNNSSNAISVDWTGVAPGLYTVEVLETDTITQCSGEPVQLTVEVVEPLQPAVSCLQVSSSEVDFSWTSVSGATSYTLEVYINGVYAYSVADLIVTDFPLPGLNPGDEVTLEVYPNGSGEACYEMGSAVCNSISCDLSATAVLSGALTCLIPTVDITVTATGGVGPYTGTGTFSEGAGSYNYTITDANGCQATTNTVVVAPAPGAPTATATVAGSLTCLIPTVDITVTATGGVGPYTGTGTFSEGAGSYN